METIREFHCFRHERMAEFQVKERNMGEICQSNLIFFKLFEYKGNLYKFVKFCLYFEILIYYSNFNVIYI